MLDVKELLTKITERLLPTNTYAYVSHDSSQMTTNANVNEEHTFSISKTGYYPLAIGGYHFTWVSGETSKLNMYSCYLSTRSDGAGTVFFAVRNTGTAQTKWKMRVYVLWAKMGGGS